MSQVKKLQAGGTTPTGKFRMNGRELSGQTAIDRLSAVYSQLPLDEREMFTVAQNAVLQGNIAEYDPTNNTIRVTDKDGNVITNTYTDTTARTTDSGVKRFFGALGNTRTHRFKKSGEAMALVDMSDPIKVEPKKESTVTNPSSEGKVEETSPQQDSNSESAEIVNPFDKNWLGNKDAAERAGITGIRDLGNGIWEILGDNQFTKNNWYTRDLDWIPEEYQHGFIIKGNDNTSRLYRADYVYNNDALKSVVAPWYGARRGNWRNYYDDINNSGFRFVNDRIWRNNPAENADDYYGAFTQEFNPETEYSSVLSDYFTKLGVNEPVSVANLNGNYEQLGNKQVFAYLDPSSWTTHGMPAPKVVVYDPETKSYTEGDNNLLEKRFPSGSGNFNTSTWTQASDKNWYAAHHSFNTIDQENTILRGRDGNYYLARKDKKGNFVKPLLIDNESFIQDIINNPSKYKDLTNSQIERIISKRKTERQAKRDRKAAAMIAGYNYGTYHKDGGKIETHQFGGNIGGTTTSKSTKDTSKSKADISSAHNIDKSNGGLTDAEWMQVGAAIGDLAGVGLTFIPGAGNIAGAATGAAASTTRFAADIKQDGFQGSDLWNYTGNLILDAASLLPVIGTGAKAVKAAKVIKAAGKPLIKLLSISGAATPVINSVSKIANGEKYTSADLAQAIQGIGSGIIATKSIKDAIGNAELAAKANAKTVKNIDVNVPRKGSAGGFEDSKTPEQLNGFVKKYPTKQKAIDAKIAEAKESGIEINAEQAENILKQQGIEFTEGKTRILNLKNIGKNKPGKILFGKDEEKATFNNPVAEKAHNALYYYLRPRKRADILGSEAVFGFGNKKGIIGDVFTPTDIANAADAAKGSKRVSLANRALLQYTAENPGAFGDLYQTGTYTNWLGVERPLYRGSELIRGRGQNRFVFGGRRYRDPRIYNMLPQHFEVNPVSPNYGRVIRTTPTLELPQGTTPLSISGRPSTLELPAYNPTVYLNSRYNPLQLNAGRGRMRDIIVPRYTPRDAVTLGKYRGIVLDQPTPVTMGKGRGFIMFNKKGGKIIKAQSGNELDLTYKWGRQLDGATVSAEDPYIKKFGASVNQNQLDRLLNDTQNKIIASLNSSNNSITGSSNPNNNPGGFIGKLPNVNWANIDDLMRGAVAASGIYKDRDIRRRAISRLRARQFLVPQADRFKYDFSNIYRSYGEQAKPFLDSKYVTSDSRDALAFNLERAQRLSALENQKNAEISQNKYTIDMQNKQIDDANEQARVNTAMEKSAYHTQLNYQDEMLDSEALNRLYANVINPLGQQFSQQGRTAQNMRNQQVYQNELKKIDRQQTINIQSKLANTGYQNKWNQLTTDEKAKYANDIENYVYSISPEDWKSIYDNSLLTDRLTMKALNNYTKSLGAMSFYKSGGKTGTKIRSVQEQIAIDGDRHAKKSTAKLSDNLMRMLQQLLK